jgi:3-methylcrotonyl-CoA carboxylase alpha subunit
MTEAMRRRMGEAAVAAARAVKYVGAGTVEFIVEQTSPGHPRAGGDPERRAATAPLDSRVRGNDEPGMNFFFMEMNTRLQVEHPVTEAITGLDLVEWQLRVAVGEPLPLKQEDLRIHGHAFEARICAENPDNNFLPATGTLHVYRKPPAASFERASVRVDDGVREGDAISPFYDSMIAKLIVHGATREEALARLDEALAATHIVGLASNVQFLRHVVRSRSFAQADLDTALIQREAAVLFHQQPVSLALAAACAVAKTLHDEAQLAGDDPFSRRDGWRSHGIALRRFEFDFGGAHAKAELGTLHDGARVLSVNGQSAPLSFRAAGDAIEVRYGAAHTRATVYTYGETDHVFTAAGAAQIVSIDLLAHAGEGAAEGGRLTAPMPGKVVSFAVRAGDKVSKGQPLAVLEAMKMEHTIAAPADGTVAELLYAPGDQVAEGAELLKLAG